MRRFSTLFTLLLVALVPRPGAAQGALTLDQAISDALERNRSLLATRASAAEAQAGVAEARAAWFPSVTVAESWQRGNQPVFAFSSLLSARRFTADRFAVDALNRPDAVGFFQTTVGLEHLLFDGGRRASATSAAALRHDIAELDTARTALDVTVSVTDAYGRVLTAAASQRAAEAGLASAREDLTRAERRRDAGFLTGADVLDLAVHVSELEQRAIEARGDAAVARAELNHLLGAPVDRDFVAVEPPSEGPSLPALSTLLAEATAARPSLRQAEAAIRLAETMRRGARAPLLPQLAAQAVVDMSGTQFTERASSWLVGGELRWTFGVGGGDLARTRAAAEAATRARIEQAEALGQVEVEVVSALRRLEAAQARHAAGQAAVMQARESQRIIRDRFEAGLAGSDDVLRASAAVLAAETRRVAAVVDALRARAQLERAVGRTS